MESKYEKEIEKSEKAPAPSEASAAETLTAAANIAAPSSYEKKEAEALSFRKKRAYAYQRDDADIADAWSLAAKQAEASSFEKKEFSEYVGRVSIGEGSSFAADRAHAPAASYHAPHGVAAELYGAGDGYGGAPAGPGPWASQAFEQRLQSPPPLAAPGRFATSAPVDPVVADGAEAGSYAGHGSLDQNGARPEGSFTFLEAQIECRTKDFDSRIPKNFIIA